MKTCRAILFLAAFATVSSTKSDNDIGGMCYGCRKILDLFEECFINSSGDSFNGGNSEWTKSHSHYNLSETRLMNIIDHMHGKRLTQTYSELFSYLEDLIDIWWKTEYIRGKSHIYQLKENICVDKSMLCCPFNRYGNECKSCSPCSPYGGFCDGNGTRIGTGKCDCRDGYYGNACRKCNLTTHFEALGTIPETKGLFCFPCDISCARGCNGKFSSNCKSCKPGWKFVRKYEDRKPTRRCTDIDECSENIHNCTDGSYCENTNGSFLCKPCAVGCKICASTRNTSCEICDEGYTLSSNETCIDSNECNGNMHICTNDNEICVNTFGSFQCVCESGYSRISSKCIKKSMGTKT